MVSYYILAVSVMLTGGVSLLLGYWLANRSADLLITWLKRERAHQERCRQAEEELAQERARGGRTR